MQLGGLRATASGVEKGGAWTSRSSCVLKEAGPEHGPGAQQDALGRAVVWVPEGLG